MVKYYNDNDIVIVIIIIISPPLSPFHALLPPSPDLTRTPVHRKGEG